MAHPFLEERTGYGGPPGVLSAAADRLLLALDVRPGLGQ